MAKRKSTTPAHARRLVPEHLRERMPQIQEFERCLTSLLANAKSQKLSLGKAAIPDALRHVLPDCPVLDELRQALVLLHHTKIPVSPEAVFRAFAPLRVLSDSEQLAELMAYLLVGGVKGARSDDPLEVDAARCFAALAGQAWQCASLFPSHAEDYAAWVRMWLDARTPRQQNRIAKSRPMRACIRAEYRPPCAPPTDDDIRLLKALLLSGGVEEFSDDLTRCGFMTWRAENAAAVTESEYALRYELPSGLLTRQGWAKYDEFAKRLERSNFDEEWGAIKVRFPAQTGDADSRTFHRTLMRERKWQGEDIARFDTDEQKFSAFFDLLCWKYCLWGVEKNRPLLMRPSVNLTPYGTQVFIPAFMSLDIGRDLDVRYLSKLHRARGVSRQGPELAGRREASRKRAIDMAEGLQDARENNVRGEARLKHVSRYVKKGASIWDGAQILREAKRGAKIIAAEQRRHSVKKVEQGERSNPEI